jgi:hypothetical protein
MRLLILCAMALAGLATTWAGAPNETDTKAIEAAVMNYAEGWFQSDPTKLEKGLHTNLNKVIVQKVRGTDTEYLAAMSREQLMAVARHNQKWVEGKSSRELKIVYQDDRIAVAHLLSDGFYDICNLAKINGQWKIVQVLWAHNPAPEK